LLFFCLFLVVFNPPPPPPSFVAVDPQKARANKWICVALWAGLSLFHLFLYLCLSVSLSLCFSLSLSLFSVTFPLPSGFGILALTLALVFGLAADDDDSNGLKTTKFEHRPNHAITHFSPITKTDTSFMGSPTYRGIVPAPQEVLGL
jgi:hypothetical protein